MLLVHRRDARNEIASRVTRVRIDFGCEESSTVEEFLNKTARDSYEPEDVYVYVHFVFGAVMKLLCTKIVRHLAKADGLTAKTRMAIGFVRNQFMYGFTSVPTNVIGRFERLQKTDTDRLTADEKAEMMSTLDRYSQDSLRTIRLDQRDSDGDAILKELDEMPLDDFAAQLTHEIDHYRCFLRLYEVLQAEYGKPYLPNRYDPMDMPWVIKSRFCSRLDAFRTRVETVETDSDQEDVSDLRKQLIDGGCGFIDHLYYICYRFIVDINLTLNENRTKSAIYFENAYSYLINVVHNLLQIVSLFPQQTLISITNRVMPYLVVLNKNFYKEETFHHQVRIANIIMPELNVYGLKHCHPPKYNFLMFNNISFDSMSREKSVQVTKTLFWASINEVRNMSHSVPNPKPMVNVWSAFNFFHIVYRQTLFKYTNYVKIMWR